MKSESIRQYAIWSSLAAVVAAMAIGFGALSVVFFQVYFGDDSSLRKTTILAKIQEETTIYTLDEETQVQRKYLDQTVLQMRF